MRDFYMLFTTVSASINSKSHPFFQMVLGVLVFMLTALQPVYAQTTVTLTSTKVSSNYLGQTTRNYGTGAVNFVANESGYLGRMFVEFDLSSIPTGAIVSSAQLRLVHANAADCAGDTEAGSAFSSNIQRVTRAWVEGTTCNAAQAGSMTWTSAGATNWTTAGGDFTGNYGSFTGGRSDADGTVYTVNIATLVTEWLGGTSNFGLALVPQGSGANYFQMYADDAATAGNRPQLIVTYTAETATLAANTVVAATTCPNSLKVPIQSFSIAQSVANGNLTGLNFTTTGTYVAGDLSNFKLWTNTTNDLSSAAQISATLSPAGPGTQTFAAFTQVLTAGQTRFFWITMDVGSPTSQKTLAVDAITTTNITTSTAKAGSSSAGGTQTIANGTDSDSDGVADVCDLDDDNDGILDTDEGTSVVGGGVCLEYNFNSNTQGWVQQNDNAGGTFALTHSSSTGTANGCSIPAGAPGSGNYILEDDLTAGSIYFESPDNLNTNLSNAVGGSLSYWWINGIRTGGGTNNSNVQNIILTGGGISVSTSISITGDVSTGWKNKTIPLTDAVWSGSAADLLTVLSDLDRIEIQVEDILASIWDGGNCSTVEYFGLDEVRITCASSTVLADIDGDGIVNALDNDSDNDGCADAIEGGANFTATSIDVNGRLTGGVNASGIPTVAGAGQTVGDSQVATALTVTTAPSNQTVTAPAAASFTIATTASTNTSWSGATNARVPVYGTLGNANPQTQYQWFLGNPDAGGTALTNTGVYSGVTTATLNISNSTGLADNQYFVVATHSNNSCIREVRGATLNPCGSLSVTPPIVTSPINNACPTTTVNLNTISAALTPSVLGGVFEWHTTYLSTSPLVSTPTGVGAGTYYLFEKSPSNCYSQSFSVQVQIQNCCPNPECIPITIIRSY
jgi:hypothetical protein